MKTLTVTLLMITLLFATPVFADTSGWNLNLTNVPSGSSDTTAPPADINWGNVSVPTDFTGGGMQAPAAAAPTQSSQFQFQPIVSIPIRTGGTVNGCTSLVDYMNAVFQLAITVGVVLAVIMIVIDGFKYMTSEAAGNKKDALAGLRSALFGLVLILASYLILFIIGGANFVSLNVLSFSGNACPDAPATQVSLSDSLNNSSALTPSSLFGGSNWCFATVDPLTQIPGSVCATSQSGCQLQQTANTAATTQCTNVGGIKLGF